MSLSAFYRSQPIPKPEPRKRIKARAKRQQRKETGLVRAYVFGRERNLCRCCRFRKAESMHELVFRSRGGKVSRKNSVAVCGDGVRGCHGFLQRRHIRYEDTNLGADGTLWFRPITPLAAMWMRVRHEQLIESPVMQETEIAGV